MNDETNLSHVPSGHVIKINKKVHSLFVIVCGRKQFFKLVGDGAFSPSKHIVSSSVILIGKLHLYF